jgi:putative membrane protein
MLTLRTIFLLALPGALWACGSGERDPVADAKFANEQRIGQADVTKRQEQDADFMVEAATGSRFGAALGQLAQRRAGNAELRAFGQQLSRDAAAVTTALGNVATQKSLALPDAMSRQQQGTLDELAALSGPAFDRELLEAATDYLDEAHEAFDDMADDAYDGDIRAVAAKYAPTLDSHHERAEQLADQLPK